MAEFASITQMKKSFAHDGEALNLLGENFTDDRGLLRPKAGYKPTDADYVAIAYLCNEWDYGYEA